MQRQAYVVRVVAGLVALFAAMPFSARSAVVPDKARIQVHAFSVAQVRLLEGPFKNAMDRDKDYLLLLDADRLLAGFRSNAGLEPKGKRYGGWEQQSLAGHSLGHHLSAVSLMYAATGDERLRQRADYIVSELAACQKASGDGYLAAFEKGREAFAEVAKGDIRTKRFDLNGIWAPWYTMHKVLAGLRDAHDLAGNQQALEAAAKLADWAISVTKDLSEQQFQHMLECEHGGMNEALADLYALTGQQKYLDLARRFYHKAVLDPLRLGVDDLTGLHGNTQIPKVIGAARQYELTADSSFKDIAEFFWRTVTEHHTFAIGGHGDNEHFGIPGRLAPMLSNHTAETCNTYNMLKLTKHLFSWSPREEYAWFYERALYNHILASQNPENGMMCYFVPLRQGTQKRFSTPENSFWCCVGTGMENHARYGESIYWHDDGGIYINLFIASRLEWPEKHVALRQETRFPEVASSKLVFESDSPAELELRIRRPSWAGDEFRVAVNGQSEPRPQENGYVLLRRAWKKGDVVDVSLPMQLWEEPLPDDPNKVALLYGPLVLAGVLGEGKAGPGQQDDDEVSKETATAPYFQPTAADVTEWVQPVPGKPLTFKTHGAGKPSDVELVPFYKVVNQTYSVYWDLVTPGLVAEREREAERERQRLADLDRRTIEKLSFGDEQAEKSHNLQGENHRNGRFRGSTWRQAERGWFSADLAVRPSEPADLVCRYWGGDGRYQWFDILVNGTKIASEQLHHEKPGEFVDHTYAIPFDLTRGKDKATVRFQSQGNLVAGSVYECRTVRLR
jgi:DUF1680 family protein